MKTGDFEKQAASSEIFSGFVFPPGSFFAVRVNAGSGIKEFRENSGRGHKIASDMMGKVADFMLRETGALLAYANYNEVTLIFGPKDNYLGRNVQRLCSRLTSMVTYFVAHEISGCKTWEASIALLPTVENCVDYLLARKSSLRSLDIASWAKHYALTDTADDAKTARAKYNALSYKDKCELVSKSWALSYDVKGALPAAGVNGWVVWRNRVSMQVVCDSGVACTDSYRDFLTDILFLG